jgi:hypothetical protein
MIFLWNDPISEVCVAGCGTTVEKVVVKDVAPLDEGTAAPLLALLPVPVGGFTFVCKAREGYRDCSAKASSAAPYHRHTNTTSVDTNWWID